MNTNVAAKNEHSSTGPSHSHGSNQFKPNTTVAAIIHCKGKFLLVEEIENGKNVFNQPAGHLEANENLIAACKREVFEESGLHVSPEYVSGIYYFHRPELNLYYLRFCFVVELEIFSETQPQDDEILACHWLSFNEIIDKEEQMRSPLVIKCIEDYLKVIDKNDTSKTKIELSALTSNL